jgi:hypothetical protein
VNAGGFQDRHIQSGAGAQQLGGDGDPGGAATHDQDLVLAVVIRYGFAHLKAMLVVPTWVGPQPIRRPPHKC